MGSTFLLAAMIALIYIAYWMLRNDRAERIADQTGFLSMRAVEGELATDRPKMKSSSRKHAHGGRAQHRSGMPLQPTSSPPSEAGTPQRSEPVEAAAAPEIIHPVYRHFARSRHRDR